VSGAGFPVGGWGAWFNAAEPTKIILFADADGDFNYDASEEKETVNLPAKASFSLTESLSIVFAPPEGTVYFNGAIGPDSKSITFQTPAAALTKTVTVYRLTGQVRVE
jgi:hypothetical protein